MPQGSEDPQRGAAPQGGGQAGQQRGSAPMGGAAGQQYGAPPQGSPAGNQWGPVPQPGPDSPVALAETRVTGRRVVQYIIDSILVSIIPGLAFWLFDRGHGWAHALGWLIAAAIWVVIMVWYWIIHPYRTNGQTFAMKWLGVRVISKDGGPVNMTQLLIRWICLIIDDLVFCLVGLITIWCSRYRQRVGDHIARTLVVRAHVQPARSDRDYASQAGTAGNRS